MWESKNKTWFYVTFVVARLLFSLWELDGSNLACTLKMTGSVFHHFTPNLKKNKINKLKYNLYSLLKKKITLNP